MAAIPTSQTRAKKIFRQHRNMLRTSDAIRLGIHPETLYSLRDSGEIEQIARGLYRLAGAPLQNPDWTAVGAQIPQAVICLVSALFHHGLTAQIPHVVDIALPSHARVPKLTNPPIRIFWFPEPAYSSGVETVPTDGIQVRAYSAEKTIADCFKYRNKVGLDVAVEALRTYKEREKRPKSQNGASVCGNESRPERDSALPGGDDVTRVTSPRPSVRNCSTVQNPKEDLFRNCSSTTPWSGFFTGWRTARTLSGLS